MAIKEAIDETHLLESQRRRTGGGRQVRQVIGRPIGATLCLFRKPTVQDQVASREPPYRLREPCLVALDRDQLPLAFLLGEEIN